MKLLNKIIIIITILLQTTPIEGETQKSVNVLTWWGYLEDPSISKLIKMKCGATLSSDTYTSNDDMLRRYHASSKRYDLLIFSDTVYNAISDQISLNKSNLWKKSKDYNLTIQKKYRESHFPTNVAYFAHSLTGFIWNSDNIHLTKDDTVLSIFKKAKNNKVILLDDPREINMLITVANDHNFKNSNNEISLINFKRLRQNSYIYISNEINKIYSQKDFAFSFQWSGDAFSRNLNSNNYNFLINNHLSYVATDLIAQLQNNKVVACAANILASKEFLSGLQNKTHYFSPYANINMVPEGEYKHLYRLFLRNLPNLQWLEPPSSSQLKQLNQEWDKVKFELAQERK